MKKGLSPWPARRAMPRSGGRSCRPCVARRAGRSARIPPPGCGSGWPPSGSSSFHALRFFALVIGPCLASNFSRAALPTGISSFSKRSGFSSQASPGLVAGLWKTLPTRAVQYPACRNRPGIETVPGRVCADVGVVGNDTGGLRIEAAEERGARRTADRVLAVGAGKGQPCRRERVEGRACGSVRSPRSRRACSGRRRR